ncbi:MAG TPA: ferritin [Bacteroidota bacterium]|nr:ferritin [Bacteroidota bacterium]
MLSKAMQDAINSQINKELYSSYLYLAMSSHFAESNLGGFASWMKVQSSEECGHAMKFYGYLIERNAHVELEAIEKPNAKFKSPVEVFKEVLAHEQKVTASIHKLYDLAVKEKDYATEIMLQWFVTEQLEEEKSAGDILEQLKMVGDSPVSIIMMDRQLAARANK